MDARTLIFDGGPQTRDKNVGARFTLAVQAHRDTFVINTAMSAP
jgi:hypothetical protein